MNSSTRSSRAAKLGVKSTKKVKPVVDSKSFKAGKGKSSDETPAKEIDLKILDEEESSEEEGNEGSSSSAFQGNDLEQVEAHHSDENDGSDDENDLNQSEEKSDEDIEQGDESENQFDSRR